VLARNAGGDAAANELNEAGKGEQDMTAQQQQLLVEFSKSFLPG